MRFFRVDDIVPTEKMDIEDYFLEFSRGARHNKRSGGPSLEPRRRPRIDMHATDLDTGDFHDSNIDRDTQPSKVSLEGVIIFASLGCLVGAVLVNYLDPSERDRMEKTAMGGAAGAIVMAIVYMLLRRRSE